MAEGDQFLVRDTRMPGHFWADNEVLDLYGPLLGAHAFAVYMALCRVAVNGTGECRISKAAIAKKLNISKGGAFNALELIVELGLAREISSGDPRNPATYILADVKAKNNHDYKQMKLASVHGMNAQPDSSVHTVNAEPSESVHGVTATAHQVNAKAHQVNAAFTPCAPYKEVKTSSRLKTENRGRGANPSPQFSQSDFDQRDLRKMAEAAKEAEKRPASVLRLDDKQYFEWICSRAGITVERGLQLEEIQRTWPEGKA